MKTFLQALLIGALIWFSFQLFVAAIRPGTFPHLGGPVREYWAITFSLDPAIRGDVELWSLNPGEKELAVDGVLNEMVRRGYRLVETYTLRNGPGLRTIWERGTATKGEIVRWMSELLQKVDEILAGLGGIAAGRRKHKG